jgi:hypothetical protein
MQAMRRLAVGYLAARCVYVAAELGIADLLVDGERSAHELAEAAGADASVLYRILRYLSGEGVFREGADRRFSLTPLGETLCRDAGNSVRPYVIMKHEFELPSAMNLLDAARSGEAPFRKTFGQPIFDLVASDEHAAAKLQAALAAGHRAADGQIAEMLDLSNCRVVVDVGGGSGSFLSALLTRHDHVSGILLDQEAGITAARSGAGGPLPRCTFVVGDFFKEVPAGGDLYILKKIIHDWSEAEAIRILRNCRQSMGVGSRIILLETPIGPANEPSWGKIQDMAMLLCVTGMERSEDEYRELLAKCDLELSCVTSITPDWAMFEALPR